MSLPFFYSVSVSPYSVIKYQIPSAIDPDNERPVKGNAEYMILKKSPCPAVIVECGFLSNPDECKALTSADYQDAMAAAIAEGIWYFITEYGDTLTE